MSDAGPQPGGESPGDPVPIRRHAALFTAELDVARLAEAGIPARVVELRGFAGPLPGLRPGGREDRPGAVVVVPASRADEAMRVLAEPAPDPEGDPAAGPGGAGDAGDAGDASGGDEGGDAGADADADRPFRPRGMPRLARLGLVLAALLLLLGILGAIATLFIGP